MLIFLLVSSIASVREHVFCFDDSIECTPEALPELPQNAKYFPFISTQFVSDGLFNVHTETIAHVVFGKPATMDLTIIRAINLLQGLHFYSPYEGIEIYLNAPMAMTVVGIVQYNFTRVIATLGPDTVTTIQFQTTQFYFFKNARITNPEKIYFFSAQNYYYPLKDFDKIQNMNFQVGSIIYLEVDMDEVTDFTIFMDRISLTLFGTTIMMQGSFISQMFTVYLYFTKNSSYQEITISINPNTVLANYDNYNFIAVYKPEKYEFNPKEYLISFRLDKSFIGYKFDATVLYQIKLNSGNLKCVFNDIQNSNYINYAIYDSQDEVIRSYPIDQTFVIYTNDSFRLIDPYILVTKYKFLSQRELDAYFQQFGTVQTVAVYFDQTLEIDFSAINVTYEIELMLYGLEEDSKIIILNPPNCNFTLSATNSIITFVSEKIDIIQEPSLTNSIITNPEVLHVYRQYCTQDELSSCVVPPGKEAYIQIEYGAILSKDSYIKFISDDQIEISCDPETYTINFGETHNINGNGIIIEFDMTLFQLFSPQNEVLVIIDKEKEVTKLPDIKFKFINSPPYFVLDFTDNFQIPLQETFHLIVLSDIQNIYTKNIPTWITYLLLNTYNPSLVYDKCPVDNDQFVICMPGTFCTGLTHSTSQSSFIYISNIYQIDYEMTEIKTRYSMSSSYNKEIVIVYSSLLLGATNEVYAIDVFEKLGLDTYTGIIHFSTEETLVPTSVAFLESTKENNAPTWIIDNMTILTLREWKIPNLYLKNNGRLVGTKIESTNIEIDSSQMEELNLMHAENITIFFTIQKSSKIVIGYDSIQINDKIATIPLTYNPTITIVCSQNETSSSSLLISPKENDDNPMNVTFIFQSISSSVIVDFSEQWKSVSNNPYYLFKANNKFDASIYHMSDPLTIMYTNIDETKIFDEFPYSKYQSMKICYANYTLFCSQYYDELETEVLFKHISNLDYLNQFFNSMNTNINNLSLYFETTTHLSITSNTHIPENVWIEAIPQLRTIYISLTGVLSTDISQLSLKNCAFEIISSSTDFRFKEIHLNSARFIGTIHAEQLFSPIFDYKYLKGTCENVILNCSFLPEAGVMNLYSNNQHNIPQSHSIKLSQSNYSIEPSYKQIIFYENDFSIDSYYVDFAPLGSHNTTFDLSFYHTDRIVFSINSFPNCYKFNFIFRFVPSLSDFYNIRKLTLEFDETWNNFTGNIITINVLNSSTPNIYYTRQNVPDIIFLNAPNSHAIDLVEENMDINQNSDENLIPIIIVIATLFLIAIICGIIIIIKTVRSHKYNKLPNDHIVSDDQHM